MKYDIAYNSLIKPKLNPNANQVRLNRGYLKEGLSEYFSTKGILLLEDAVFSVEELVSLDELGWTSDHTEFTLNNRVVIPIKSAKGEVLTLVGWRRGASKYLTLPSENFSKESHWFNIDSALEKSFSENALDEFKNSVVVVEGIFDALMLDYLGIPAIATMGSTVNSFKGELLNLFDHILCIPDNDGVGTKAVLNWKVPPSANFLYLPKERVNFGDFSKYVKDVDDLVNFYEEDTVRAMISYYLREGGRVSYLTL